MNTQTIISEKTFEKARIKIKANKEKSIIFSSNNDDLNRKILEKEKINILLINLKDRKDYQKQRNSGFNQVLAKIAQKNKVTIGINFDEIIEAKNKTEKTKILSRIQQNIMLCKKHKLSMKFIIQNKNNQRNAYDLKSLALVLGMPTSRVKNL